MKNILLKFNMVLIFVVILFANFVVVQADENVTLKLVGDGKDPETGEYVYSLNVREGRGDYVIVIDEEDKFISIVGKRSDDASSDDVSTAGQAPIRVTLSNEYTYTVRTKSSLAQSRIIKWEEAINSPEYADLDLSSLYGADSANLTDIPKVGKAEKVITMYFLDFGDFAEKFLNKIFKEEITIDKIVFNQVDMLNANFFKNTTNSAKNTTSNIIREYINKWFGYFKSLALVVIMVLIVASGIRILLQTPQAKVKAYESLKKVFFAVALIFFFPYVMKFAFEINESIIGYINKGSSYGIINPASISPYANADEEELEFRSPKYVSDELKKSNSDSSDNTEINIDKLTLYENDLDIMRMIRAFAGVTYRFVYVVLWYIMLAQVYILAFIYIKRYLTIAFLIIIYPLVIIGYVVDGISGKRKGAFNTWSKKFFSSVFLQTIHAIMYGIISGVLVNQILKTGDGTIGSQKINVILMIVVTSFLFSGEKILTKFWQSSIDSSAERKGLRNIVRMPKNIIKSFKK